MTTATHNYGWLMPDPGGSANTWGNTLNGTTQAIDTKVQLINNQVTPNTISVSRGADGLVNGTIDFLNATGAQPRWQIVETSDAEGAGNAGSNFALNAFDNTGAFLSTVFEVIRATQAASFAQAVSIGAGLTVTGNSGITGSLGVSANLVANTVTSTGGAVVVQAPASGDSILELTNSSGALQGYLQWVHTTNTVNLVNQNGSGSLSIGSDGITHTSGGLQSSGDFWVHSGNIYNQAASGGNSNCWFMRNDGVQMGVVYYTMASSTIAMQNQIGGGQATIDGVANFRVNGGALKPGGGAWLDSSDARIKTVTGSYSAGLDEVARLNPVRFTYKGNDGDAHALVKGREFIGLVADEAMRVMPELVTLSEGEIDGRKVSDLKMLDPTAIIYALINSLKELKAEIEELKAAR